MKYELLKNFQKRLIQSTFVDWTRSKVIVDGKMSFNIVFLNIGDKHYPYVQLPEMDIEPAN